MIVAIFNLSRRDKFILLIFAFIAASGLIWWGKNFYARNTVLVPDFGGVYTEGVVGNPRLVNPVLADTNEADGAAEALIFNGLFRSDGNGGLEYDLAEILSVSTNRKEYLVTLKSNLLWHDGEPITVDDVLFTIDLIKNPALRNPYALNWQGVNTEKISERTMRLTIPAPYAQFQQNLTFRILPKHLWKDIATQSFSHSELNIKPIGSGPYRFKNVQKDKAGAITSYTLVANKKYHHQGPYLDSVVLRFYASYEEAIVALKKKEIDGLAGIPPNDFKSISDRNSLKIITPLLPRYFAVFWNNDIKPLDDVKTRQALTLAINKERIINDVLGGQGKVLQGPIMDGLLGGGGNPANTTYDPDKSRKLLEELGWKDTDGDGIRDQKAAGRSKKLTKLEFELFLPNTPLLQSVVTNLVEDWGQVGVHVIPKPTDLAELLNALQARSYRAVLFGQVLSQDPDPFAFWHPSQKQAPGLNLSLWSNKKGGALLEKIRITTDAGERKKLLEEFNALVANDYPALFLYSPNYIYAISGAFHIPELKIINFPFERFNKINEWYMQTQRTWK